MTLLHLWLVKGKNPKNKATDILQQKRVSEPHGKRLSYFKPLALQIIDFGVWVSELIVFRQLRVDWFSGFFFHETEALWKQIPNLRSSRTRIHRTEQINVGNVIELFGILSCFKVLSSGYMKYDSRFIKLIQGDIY